MTRLAALWRDHRILLLAFAASAVLTLFFAVRFLFFVAYWHDPAHRDQAVEGWMTIGYVAHSYHVSRDALAVAIDLQPSAGKRRTIADIARDRGVAVDALVSEINRAVATIRKEGADR